MVEAHQDVLDVLPDGVVVAGPDGRVTSVNAAARRMLGPEARVGAPLEDAVCLLDQDGRDWSSTVRPYGGLSTRKAVPEQSWVLPDGSEVLVTAQLVRRRSGGPVEAVALVLRSARGRERLDRDRSDLVATVAHELRSPLTGVKGFVTTLLNRWDRLNDDQKKLMLTTVATDSDRLARLITELLDVARIDTGRLSLFRRELELAPLVDRVADSVRAGTTRTILVEHADPEAVVFADPDKFTQVLTNLVENAVRHGEGTVRVATDPVAEPFKGVQITVDDEGEGIDEEIRKRVFTKFWKHGIRGGSGLGMYIVHGLTQVHGGDVRIDDAPGGGARVMIRWPSQEPGETAVP
ncbi:MAG TPA: PAS domain-containing sensor histidine kinase [Marmoricola sp.]|nr:PAS domain-containing sensor histidine kinase [Marmoricola sp.]